MIILWHELAKKCKFCKWRNHDLHLPFRASIVNTAICQKSLTSSTFKHNTQDLRRCNKLFLKILTHWRQRKKTIAVFRTLTRFKYFCYCYANGQFHQAPVTLVTQNKLPSAEATCHKHMWWAHTNYTLVHVCKWSASCFSQLNTRESAHTGSRISHRESTEKFKWQTSAPNKNLTWSFRPKQAT